MSSVMAGNLGRNDGQLLLEFRRHPISKLPSAKMLNFQAARDSLMRNQLAAKRNNTVAKKSFTQIAVA
jgi:hypothetical protein